MSRIHREHWPNGLPYDVTVPQTNLFYNAEVAAARYPSKAFAVFFDRVLTYAQFKDEAERLAGFLQHECAVGPGDRVLLSMQNSPQFIIAYYAVLRADAIVVPVNPMSVASEFEHLVQDSGAKVALIGQEIYPQIEPLLGKSLSHAITAAYSDYADLSTSLRMPEVVSAAREQISHVAVTLWGDALGRNLTPGPLTMRSDDLCVIPYSSGTTGQSKGCMLTHRNLMHTAVANALWFRSHPDLSQLVVLPFFHVTSMQGGMNAPIFYGGTIVLMCRWDRDVAAELIQRHRLKLWTAISTMVMDFLANPRLDRYELASLQRVSGGGAAMPAAVAERLKQLVGAPYVEGYGLTETAAPTHINPVERPKRQCLGIPIFNTDSRIVDPQTLQELPAGELGEIVTHGPQVFAGYWRNEAATHAAFVELDGKRFFRTGDLGYIDEEGYFFLVDRLKRMINAAGYKVWPAEVEAQMYRHPAIQEACVIAANDARRGQTVKAWVVLRASHRGTVTEQEIIDWARQQMAAYKYPRIVQFAESLPKSATGKVQWRALQEAEMARV